MTEREEHGKARAGKVTASVAHTIMRGSFDAWKSLKALLWADDGSDFATAVGGARGHGLKFESVGLGLFWERHPDYLIEKGRFMPFKAKGYRADHPYRRLLGFSPDALATALLTGKRLAGVEVKSPASEERFNALKEEAGIPKGERFSSMKHKPVIPKEFRDQVLFSLWASGLEAWWLVVHYEGEYFECYVRRDSDLAWWVPRFRPKMDAFIKFYLADEAPKEDRLAAGALKGLL